MCDYVNLCSSIMSPLSSSSFFFFNDTATTEIYTLSLHDALPICHQADLSKASSSEVISRTAALLVACMGGFVLARDRKSTRLNSSHGYISYAVFCLKKKKKKTKNADRSLTNTEQRHRRC